MGYTRTDLHKVLTIDGIYTIHYYEYTKDFAYSGEFHDFWEIVYADKKGVVITAGATELTLEAGQLYIHKPNEFHTIRCDGMRAANSVILSFDCSSPELLSISGNVITINTTNSILQGEKKLIAAVGLENLVVIDTEDAILICQKDHTGDIKKVLEHLRICNRTDYL